MTIKKEIEQEIELAKMMVADIDKVYKKYAKAALKAEQERIERNRVKKYKDCTNPAELQELYGYDEITEKEYYSGLEFFRTYEERIVQLSVVERHRKNLKAIRDRWKGTVNELQEELNEIDGVVKDNRTYVERLEAEERAERYASLS